MAGGKWGRGGRGSGKCGGCFTCGEEGHRSRECSKGGGKSRSSVCYTCGEDGHWSTKCPGGGGEESKWTRGRGGGGRPRGLRGRNIGLFYAERSRGRGGVLRADRMARERTVAHINRKELEMLEKKLLLVDGLSDGEGNNQTGILDILEDNIRGNKQRDGQREWALRTRIGKLTRVVDRGVMNNNGDVIKEELEDKSVIKLEEDSKYSNHMTSVVVKKENNADGDYIESKPATEIKNEPGCDIGDTTNYVKLERIYRKSERGYCLSTTASSSTTLSDQLAKELVRQQNTAKYKDMLQFRKKLPSYAMKEEVVQLVRNNQVVVLTGETGCGKTTQVPQFLLEDSLAKGMGSTTRIVVTQPRRISAITVAERVARERGEECGEKCSTAGYQIRLESRLPRVFGSILYCTTGIVLSWLRSLPTLPSISHLVMDEVHERDIQSDFLMTVIRDLLPARPDLKLVLMSATLNAEKLSQYFGNCPAINIPGFTFPVQEFYLEDVLEMTKYKPFEKKKTFNNWQGYKRRGKGAREQVEYERDMSNWFKIIEGCGKYSDQTLNNLKSVECEKLDVDLVAATVNHIHRKEKEGAILVFVPGWDQISKVHKLLTEDRLYKLGGKVKVYPLHSMMPTVSQKEIFNKPPQGTRKVIVATNIAETSITIEDVVFVVDCGKIKMTNFDVSTNLSTLQPEWVSLANAKQRRGRSGRVQPGQCYHLFSRGRKELLAEFLEPEMRRSRLEEVVLQVKLLQLGTAQKFLEQTLDPPDPRALMYSLDLLQTMSAITVGDGTESLTPLGFHLAQLPMNPQTGKMVLLAAIFSCLDPVLSVAASLSFKDPFMIPLGKERAADLAKQSLASNTRSDHLLLANALSEYENSYNRSSYCWDNFLSESTLKLLLNMKKQFGEHLFKAKFLLTEDILAKSANINSDNESLVRAVICAGLYPNVAKIKKVKTKPFNQTRLESKTDKTLNFHPKSVLVDETAFKYPWMVYHLKLVSTKAYLFDASMVSPLALLFFGETVRIGQEKLSSGQIVETVSADDYVKFNCEKSTSRLVQRLRMELDKILEMKISNPCPTQWGDGREGQILQAIVRLLDTEIVGGDTSEDEENDADDGTGSV